MASKFVNKKMVVFYFKNKFYVPVHRVVEENNGQEVCKQRYGGRGSGGESSTSL